jgi:hypothetical protein
MERTLRWAERCRSAHRRPDRLLFGVVQGGAFPDLRRESALRTAALGLRAFAIGGFGLGEAHGLRNELVGLVIDALPRATARHLMGVGMPRELEAVALGADLFVPTRHGRRGWFFTRDGRFNVRHARFVEDRATSRSPRRPPCSAAWTRRARRGTWSCGERSPTWPRGRAGCRSWTWPTPPRRLCAARSTRPGSPRGWTSSRTRRWRWWRTAPAGSASSTCRTRRPGDHRLGVHRRGRARRRRPGRLRLRRRLHPQLHERRPGRFRGPPWSGARWRRRPPGVSWT